MIIMYFICEVYLFSASLTLRYALDKIYPMFAILS
jgi:hypothetical protein